LLVFVNPREYPIPLCNTWQLKELVVAGEKASEEYIFIRLSALLFPSIRKSLESVEEIYELRG
jgi:hypothetical protein